MRGSSGAPRNPTRAAARRETEVVLMTQKEVLDELKGLVVERLKFDPRRAAEMTLETTLPKGVDGSLGLDSLDFIELSVAIEERFGIVIDEAHDLTDEFLSLDSLSRFILAKNGQA
jgi:acyl carrier protein